MQQWERILDFPNYSVSDQGLVRNDDTDRIMAIRKNSAGVHYVGLVKGKKQYNRSLALLVATAFLPEPVSYRIDANNMPIHLNGHRDDNYAHNLMWRPYFYARLYQQQFKKGPTTAHPIVEINTDERFSCPFVAAMTFGLLESDIISSALNRTIIWLTQQEFRFVED